MFNSLLVNTNVLITELTVLPNINHLYGVTHFAFSILGEFKSLVFPRNPVAASEGSTQETRQRKGETSKSPEDRSDEGLRNKTNNLAFTLCIRYRVSLRCLCVYKVVDQTAIFVPVQCVN